MTFYSFWIDLSCTRTRTILFQFLYSIENNTLCALRPPRKITTKTIIIWCVRILMAKLGCFFLLVRTVQPIFEFVCANPQGPNFSTSNSVSFSPTVRTAYVVRISFANVHHITHSTHSIHVSVAAKHFFLILGIRLLRKKQRRTLFIDWS